jgi:RNA-directed DNA polymerase
MTFPLDDFIAKAKAENRSQVFIDETTAYIQQLEKSNLPVLFTLEHLCLEARVNIRRFRSLLHSSRFNGYERFKLKKRNGGYRTIHVPDNDLKYLQRWLLHNVLFQVPSHVHCKGFDPGTSIKANAAEHLGKAAILKIDLLRFYDSINEHRVFAIFKHMGYHPNLAVYLAKICTVVPDNNFFIAFKEHELKLRDQIRGSGQGILPQGAPTSPKLANLVARRLDKRLTGLAEKHQVSYTRYADDLTFSGELTKLEVMKKVIYRIIRSEGFFVNLGKTKILVRGSQYLVTGLSVDHASVRVPGRIKKEIEHHLFHCVKNGAHIHLMRSGVKNRNFKDWLLGKICFVHDIEKETGQRYLQDFKRIEWPI